MERNSGASESSSVPYESNFEEQREVGSAALCLCTFTFQKPDYETAMKLDSTKTRNLAKKSGKRRVECRAATGNSKKDGSVVKFPEAGKGIDGCILPELPPVEKLKGFIGRCSKPFEKQLTKSDLKESQNRLLFNAKDVNDLLLPLLNPDEDLAAGIPVTTYDSEGRQHPMTFKVWHGRAYVLIGKWIEFARNHGFEEAIDWVTVWMFRHSRSEKLCFVIIARRLPTFAMLARRRGTALPPAI